MWWSNREARAGGQTGGGRKMALRDRAPCATQTCPRRRRRCPGQLNEDLPSLLTHHVIYRKSFHG